MSYLSFPRLDFFGTFRADPSTLNNTPDNFNPNNQFPPNEGDEIGNNIQLYWNPNGTAAFELDCDVTKVYYANGATATMQEEDSIVGQKLYSLNNNRLHNARVVDLDPMQQNVTELWGLQVGIGTGKTNILSGAFKPSAYSNAWVQVVNGRGDYAGSAFYQSVLQLKEMESGISPFLESLRLDDGSLPTLSMSFTLRSYNSASHQYLVSEKDKTLAKLNQQGIPVSVTNKLIPLTLYNQTVKGKGTLGLIPTTSYFTKLLKTMLSQDEYTKYGEQILAFTQQKGYKGLTDYDFTYGQVFGSIGLHTPEAPEFLTPNRMLTPTSVNLTKPPIQQPTDSGAYKGYFAPFKLNQFIDSSGEKASCITVNLGNSLPSTAPASKDNSFVDTASLGQLMICCFPEGLDQQALLLGEVPYQDNDFYVKDAGIVNIPINEKYIDLIEHTPLGLVSVDANGTSKEIILHENPEGYYLRANQFVYRMNPGTQADELNPGEAKVEFYASQYGRPASNMDIEVSMLSSLEASMYSNNTLGTGGTSGMVNMSVPRSAVELEGKADTPVIITTDANGKALLSIKSLNPGNPRGYMDGQIYFLRYGFKEESIKRTYIQSPDDLISLQVYEQDPVIEDVTWANFVQPVLAQYAKIYPVMSFLDLSNKASVIANADAIRSKLTSSVESGEFMPVTRDMSATRLKLIVEWLNKVSPPTTSPQYT